MFVQRKELTPRNILSEISEFSIFENYCNNFKEVGVKFKSEFREEGVPSCVINYYNGQLWYKDFGSSEKAVNCFQFVMKKYNLTFPQALGIINTDFNIGLKSYEVLRPSLNYVGLPDKKIPEFKEKMESIFEVEYRDWLKIDEKFWYNRYYLKISRLEYYDIKPINKFYIINDKMEGYIKIPLETYAFLIDIENGSKKFKIYSPFSTTLKWLSNCKANHYQGFNQLPWLHNNLIITKSLKDVAVFSLFKIPSIAPQSESQLISKEFMASLKQRFKHIYLFYDNDRAGKEGSSKNSFEHNLTELFIPDKYGVKDISDMLHKYRFEETKQLLKRLIK